MYRFRLGLIITLLSVALAGHAYAEPGWGPSCNGTSCHGTPVVTDFQLPASHDALTVPINGFSAIDTDPRNKTSVNGYMLTMSASVPNASDSGWQSSPPTQYTFNADGLHTLYAWAKDSFGTVSAAVSDAVDIIIAVPNILPVADAGPNQSAQEGDVVTLNGTNSIDDDGTIIEYFWELKDEGVIVVLSDPFADKPTFDAPAVGPNGVSLTFTLTVTDDSDGTHSATTIVNITNVNADPVADAGLDQTVGEGELVLLDGSGSSGVDDNIVGYLWKQINIAGVVVELDDPTIVNPQFVLDSVSDQGQSVTFQLTVTDDGGLQSTDTVVINITNVNQPPTAVTGETQSVMAGDEVTLDASGSSDPDGPLANDAYTWKQKNGPAVTLSDPGAVNPVFTAPAIAAGTTETLTFELTVTDGLLQSTAICEIMVTAESTPPVEEPPVEEPPVEEPPVEEPPVEEPPVEEPPVEEPPVEEPPAEEPPVEEPPVEEPPVEEPPVIDDSDDSDSDDSDDSDSDSDSDDSDDSDDSGSYDDDDDEKDERKELRKKRSFKRWSWRMIFNRFNRN